LVFHCLLSLASASQCRNTGRRSVNATTHNNNNQHQQKLQPSGTWLMAGDFGCGQARGDLAEAMQMDGLVVVVAEQAEE
jgi:hypothetical protein